MMKIRILIFILGIGMVSCQQNKSEEIIAIEETPGFFHNVYFFLADSLQSKDLKLFEEGLAELGTIETLIDYHVGKPAMTPREVVDNSYDYAIVTSFADKEGHDAYQVHPIHDKFREAIEGIVDSVQIYDTLISH